LRHFERDGLTGELAVGEEAVESAFEIATVVGHGLGDELEHGGGNIEAGMMRSGGGGPAFEGFKPQFLASDPISTTSPTASRERTRSSRLSRSDGGRSAAMTTWRPASMRALSV